MKGSLNLNAIWGTQNILKLKNKVSVSWGNIKQPIAHLHLKLQGEKYENYTEKKDQINYENPNIQIFVEKR